MNSAVRSAIIQPNPARVGDRATALMASRESYEIASACFGQGGRA
jgi:hypothetical protein